MRSSPTPTSSPTPPRPAAATRAAPRSRKPTRSTSSSATAIRFPRRSSARISTADVALIKVDPDGLDLKPIELGDSDNVQVGAPVAAIGSPFGQEQSLSVGIVSATDRSIDSLTQFKIDGAIQTDTSINPGNSGGPLIGSDGRVIGIDQQINTTSGGNEGVGFAVPVNLVKRSIDQLRDERAGLLRLYRRQEPAALSAARREARHRCADRVADLERRLRRPRRQGGAAGQVGGLRLLDRVPGTQDLRRRRRDRRGRWREARSRRTTSRG